MNIQTTIENLKKRGYVVSFFENGHEAAEHIALQESGKTIGIGGSVTVEQIGLYDLLTPNNTVYWHWNKKDKTIIENASRAQIYITSANGVAETGEIVNIDGNGNRVAATIFGHEKLYIIIGVNKIEDTLEKAIFRARNIAAPLNAKRLKRNTPCAISKEMRCYDCNSLERICKAMSIHFAPTNAFQSCEVVIINQQLGF